MKEREPIRQTQGKIELTIKPNLTNLETGEIFMAEVGEGPKPTQGEAKNENRIRPEETVSKLARIRAERIAERGFSFPVELEGATVEVKNAYQRYIEEQAREVEKTFTKDGPETVTVKEGQKGEEELLKLGESLLSDVINKLPQGSVAKYRRRIREATKLKPQLADKRLAKIRSDIGTELEKVKTEAKEGPRPSLIKRILQGVDTETQREMAEIKLGEATWKNRDSDQPVRITGYKGVGPDGRKYVSIEGSQTGIPLDEIQYPQTERERQAEEIIENAEDFYSAAEKLIRSEDESIAEEIIENSGEDIINLYREGLRLEQGKYTDEFNELKNLPAGEARERFVDIINRLKNERKSQKLSDPFTSEAEKQEQKLTDDEKHEIERLQQNGEAKTQDNLIKRHHDIDSVSETVRRLERIKRGESESVNVDQGTRSQEPNTQVAHEEDFIEDFKDVFGILSTEDLSSSQKMQALKGNDGIRNVILNVYPRIDKRNLIYEELKKIEEITDPNEFVRKYHELMQQITEENQRNKSENSFIGGSNGADSYEYSMNSLEDVSKFIANKINKDLYGPDGIYPLIKEDGTINQSNFLIFVRDYTLILHEGNINDAISPLTQIVLEGRLRAVSLIMMVKSNRQQYFRDAKSNMVLDKLADQSLYESWAFGIIRNTHLAYKQVMTSDTELPKQIPDFHRRSDITRGNTLEIMLSAPDDFEKGDMKVGDGMRFANDFYYNISDKDELVNMLGKYQFTQEDFKNALRIIQGKKDWDENNWNDIDSYQGYYDKNEGRFYYQVKEGGPKTYLFDKDGNIDMTAFVNSLNFYNENTPKESLIGLVRELVRLKASQKFGLRNGIATTSEERLRAHNEWEQRVKSELELKKADPKNEGRSKEQLRKDAENEADRWFMVKRNGLRINLKFAETGGFEMQRPYGAAARSDVTRRGFDAATKLYTRDYLTRQSGENTAGPIGIPGEIPIFKTLGVDMWVGLKTESGLSPYEMFKKLREIDLSDASEAEKEKAKREWLSRLRFRERAESEFAGNQTSSAFEIFHSISGGRNLDLNQIVSFSFLEGVKFNPQKFEEQINDGFIKPMRYAFSSNSGLNLNTEVRWHDYAKTKRINDQIDLANKNRAPQDKQPHIAPIYETVSLARAMFSDEVLEGVLEEFGTFDTQEARQRIMKNAARTRIAAQLKFHTAIGSTGEYWGYNRTETFIDALKTMREYEVDPDDPDKVRQTGRSFFSKEDIEWIRKQGKTEVWRMLLKDSIREGTPGLLGGSWAGIQMFFRALGKDAFG